MCNVGDGFPTQGEFFHAAGAKGWAVERTNRAWGWLLNRRAADKFKIRTAADIIDAMDAVPLDVVASPDGIHSPNDAVAALDKWAQSQAQAQDQQQVHARAQRDTVVDRAGKFWCPCCHRP